MLAWLISVLIELGGGLALLLGLATRPAAVVVGLWCIATAIVVNSKFDDHALRVQLSLSEIPEVHRLRHQPVSCTCHARRRE